MNFKQAYPAFADFETKVKTIAIADFTTVPAYLDDTKMYSNWETIYNFIANHYGLKDLRYEGAELDGFFAMSLIEELPAIYVRQQVWVQDNYAVLQDVKSRGNITDKVSDTIKDGTNTTTNETTTNSATTGNAFGGDAAPLADTDKVAMKDREKLSGTLTQTSNKSDNLNLTDNEYNIYRDLDRASKGLITFGLNALWKRLDNLFRVFEAFDTPVVQSGVTPEGNDIYMEIKNALVAGANIKLDANDGAMKITISATSTDIYEGLKTSLKEGSGITIDFDDTARTATLSSTATGDNSFTYNLPNAPDGQGYLIMKGEDIKKVGFSPVAFEFIVNDAYLSQIAAGYILPTLDNQSGRYTAEIDIRDTDNGAPNTIALLKNIAFTVNQNNGDIWMSPKAVYPVTFYWFASIIGTALTRNPILEPLPQTNTIPTYPYFKNNGNPTFYRNNGELNDIILATTDDFLGMVDVFTNPDGSTENKVFFWYEHNSGTTHKISSLEFQNIIAQVNKNTTDIATNTGELNNAKISISNIVNNLLPDKADKDLSNTPQQRLLSANSAEDAKIIDVVKGNVTGHQATHIAADGTIYTSWSVGSNALMRLSPPSGNLPDGQLSVVFSGGTESKTLKEIMNPTASEPAWTMVTSGSLVWNDAEKQYNFEYRAGLENGKDYLLKVFNDVSKETDDSVNFTLMFDDGTSYSNTDFRATQGTNCVWKIEYNVGIANNFTLQIAGTNQTQFLDGHSVTIYKKGA